MLLPLVLALAAQAPKPPTAADLSSAWYAEIPTGGMPHCPQVRKFKAKRTADPATYMVEYGFSSKAERFSAKLKFDGSNWKWLSGDFPRCSVIIIADQEGKED
jgi:hypothetical protein